MSEAVVGLVDLHVFRWQVGTPSYLIMQRSPGEIYEHIWQGVTGKINAQELAWEAAVRELREETGLQPKRMWTVDHVNFFYEAATDQLNCIPVFGVEVDDGPVVLSAEHSTHRWCPVDEAVSLILWDQQKKGLRTFHDMLTASTGKLKWMEITIKDA